jgi:competence protein ComEC
MGRLLLGLSLSVLVVSGARGDGADGRLDVYFVDVEGGAATLVVTPAGESLLIDSGYPDNNGRDLDRITRVARKVAGLERLDHAAVTHWHVDHFGNHAALSTRIPVGTFWDRGIPETLAEDDRIAEYRRATQNASKTLRAGDTLPLKAGEPRLGVRIVTASREVIPNDGPANPFADLHEPRPADPSDNADSLSFLLEFGPFRFLCCGDLTWNVEGKLVTPNNPLGTVDAFMVTHHGLPTSNNPALVLAIDPRVAVMCNGPTKGGARETIETLRRVKSLEHLYQLHENVKLAADEQTPAAFIANATPTARCEGRYVHLSVAPDARSYRLRIEGREEVHEYETRAR